MVLQKNVLFSGTILDNLRWGDENASEEECIRVAKLACADEFIERFPDKYNTWIEQGGSNVSGGQKQRLTIARACCASRKSSSLTTPPVPWIPPPTQRSGRRSVRRSPAPPRSSLHSAFPRCRMPTASSCWTTARSTARHPRGTAEEQRDLSGSLQQPDSGRRRLRQAGR